ncbi:hypothetical protein BZA77DRAFT_295700 [Pyronema omphalodes]|nr:hypothetical protein BZA77DRAFT_295700 [Pyronema omphalodes]
MSDCRSTIDSSMHLEPVLASFCNHPASRRYITSDLPQLLWYLIFDDWCSGHRSWVAVLVARNGRMKGLFCEDEGMEDGRMVGKGSQVARGCLMTDAVQGRNIAKKSSDPQIFRSSGLAIFNQSILNVVTIELCKRQASSLR